VAALSLAGCSSRASDPTVEQPASATAEIADPSALIELQKIREMRESNNFKPTFVFGPGDVIEISVPDIDEIKDRKVRVSSEGVIELPVVGTVQVAGLTEEQFHAQLRRQLSKYVKDPQVDIFVSQSFSREVAVVGGVTKPGLYALNSNSDTLLDIINQAGGLSGQAADTIVFIPAPANGVQRPNLTRLLTSSSASAGVERTETTAAATAQTTLAAGAAEQPTQPLPVAARAEGMTLIPASYGMKDKPIVINMTGALGEAALAIPARPGDVIIVPAGGSVMVQGWVKMEGAYSVTHGMTVLSAVTAAGGEQFTSSATLLRAGPGGKKIPTALDLSAIERGQAPDLPVQAGDVIIVNRSAVGAVPYFVYFLAQHFGAGVSAAAF
jgi:protein involved in polysaccharide export with SLBB domain